MKKVVFFDIDGTLWDQHFKIPESTREAIHKLRENGHLAFICSGRTTAFIHDESLLSLGFDGMVAGCGTYVEYQNKELFYKKLDNKQVEHTLAILEKYQMRPVLEGKEHLYIEEKDWEVNEFGNLLKEELGNKLLSISENFGQWEISKMSCNPINDNYIKAIDELAGDYDALIHTTSTIELIPKGFSKASGIQKVCELLQIAHEDTYAFGDSVNDLEMLAYVYKGIAMGNGTQIAKDISDYVTTDLHEDGIYNGLKHFGLI